MDETPLSDAVRGSLDALDLGPADGALEALALSLAASIDGMDDDMRARMIGQTSAALMRVLAVLSTRPLRTPAALDPRRAAHNEIAARRDARKAREAEHRAS